MNNWKYDLFTGLGNVSTMQDVLGTATRAAHALGFDYCGWLSQLAQPLPKVGHLCFTSTEDAVHERIRQGRYDETPARRHCAAKTSPFMWTGGTNDSVFLQIPDIAEEYYSSGHRGGWAQSVILDDGLSYMFYTDSRDEIPMHELEQRSPHLTWVAAAVHARMLAFKTPSSVTLTFRERDILRYLGEGVDLPDICLKMKLSAETVEFHLENALYKLEIPDIRTAIAQACFMGFLH
ncbi:helix-turn-helix transcriptional regulator [Zymobacter sp. IVIA_12111.31 C1]|uniref:helix-turn-helix transcriptional regulator n=1 Tax=Zymobacter sp. IVIA_12111.31 C1 TaxID=3394854 RepID=UPI0039C348E9